MTGEVWSLRSEAMRERVINLIRGAPLYDKAGRCIVVDLRRESTAIGASKKRLFHAYCNVLADYKEVPAGAMKMTLKAHVCPLVPQTDLITGEITYRPKGISELDDDEAALVCEKVVKLAGDEWKLPLPSSEAEWDICKAGGLEALIEFKRYDDDKAQG